MDPHKSGMASDEKSVTSEVGDARFWKRAWSVQSIIALLCLACILLTAVSTEVMNTITCERALDDTRDTMDDSTDALGSIAQTSLTRVSGEMMDYVSAGAKKVLELQMDSTLRVSSLIDKFTTGKYGMLNKTDAVFMNSICSELWHFLTDLPRDSAIVALGITYGDYGVTIVNAAQFNVDIEGFGTESYMSGVMEPYKGTQYTLVENVTGLPILTNFSLYFPTNVSTLPSTPLLRSPVWGMGESVFPTVSPISKFVGYVLMSKLRDVSMSQPSVESYVYIGLDNIQKFLKSVTAGAGDHAIMRAYTSIASTWMAKRLQMDVLEQDGLLTGVSAGESTYAYSGIDNMLGIPRELFNARTAVNASDPYIKAIAIKLHQNYSSYADQSQLVDILVNGTVPEQHFVSVERLQFPANGLDWWLTVSIDGESVLGDVQRETVKVNADIAEKKDDVADEVEEKKMLQRGIIIGIGALLVVLSAFTSHILLRPVKALQRSMELVANMELDEVDISKSTFYELRLMQRDFTKMIENLVEFRAYVPSSVLESSGYSGEGGKTVVAPPTGNVAIVFTDIRGSTSLWKASAADMNVAMEIHNEVMRDACVAHKGYEVKTIGDSFMVSFACPFAAANFALDVQTNLKSKEWPIGLNLPEAGMVVRIGINYGATIAEENPVTGRVDYRGSTVNLASRVEAKALPGTVCVTTDMYVAIKGSLDKVGNPAVKNTGTHEIRGLGNGHELYMLAPQALNRRLSYDTDTDMKQDARQPLNQAEEGVKDKTHSIESYPSGIRQQQSCAKRTALQVQRTTVTVAVCRLVGEGKDGSMFDNCNIMVRAALEAAQSTDGVIGNVTGCTLTVVWNASKRCLMHTTAALTFVSEMKKLQGIIQVGLATGTMLHGNVGTRTSRFATAFGAPLEAAEAMTDHAHRLGVYCLMADCTSDKRLQADQTLRSCLRLVDAWCDLDRDRVTQIFEVSLSHLDSALQAWALVGTGSTGNSTNHADLEYQTIKVHDAMKGGDGIAQLGELADEFPDDRVLQKVVDMMRNAVPLPCQGFRTYIQFRHYCEVNAPRK